MSEPYLFRIERRKLPHHVGEKARNLQRLFRFGFPIPKSYAVSWRLENIVAAAGNDFPPEFVNALEAILEPGVQYAVRSSANAEDAEAQSFAGQFLTMLDVEGIDAVLQAILSVWDSAHLELPAAYRSKKGMEAGDLEMGVIIQRMIPAVVSGVAFSRNPITGLDEVVLEAVEGSGVYLVQEGVTPDRWIWKWGKVLQKPSEPLLPDSLIDDIARTVRAIGEQCDYPVDLEWVYDGQDVTWVQMRQITTLDSIDIYANHIPKEFIPGIIKPLVWTVNIPLVNEAWIWLLTELLGANELDPYCLARQFYGRAYFNMGLLGSVFRQLGIPENTLERLMGYEAEGEDAPGFKPSLKVLRYLPRMLAFAIDKLRFESKLENFLQHIQLAYAELSAEDIECASPEKVLDVVERLYELNQRTAYFNIVTPLLMQVYHRLAKRKLNSLEIDYEDIHWLEGWEEREQYDPAPGLRRLGVAYAALNEEDRKALAAGHADLTSASRAFQAERDVFMARFGHLSDSGNDFSRPLWEEMPELILEMIEGFASEPASTVIEEKESTAGVELEGFIIKRAIEFSRYREQVSYLYTRGFGDFRRAYRRLGELFVRHGWLEEREDIYFLEQGEIASIVREGDHVDEMRELVEDRKAAHAAYASVTPPPIVYGDQVPPIVEDTAVMMEGIPTSRGVYRGRVCVVRGVADFSKVEEGCVLVIPYSDVSWTPLFARAGAVVAESGGILSHSSIVAREYGIPAIVAVTNACVIEDGIEVTVDGFSGRIIQHDADEREKGV